MVCSEQRLTSNSILCGNEELRQEPAQSKQYFGHWKRDIVILILLPYTGLYCMNLTIATSINAHLLLMHRNEADVGSAIVRSGLPRADIFLTTKLWNSRCAECMRLSSALAAPRIGHTDASGVRPAFSRGPQAR